MKALIIALALLVAPLGASARTSDEGCAQVATVIFFVAEGRDLGSRPDVVYEALLANDIPADMAMAIITTVFFDNPGVSSIDIAEEFLNYCTSEAV